MNIRKTILKWVDRLLTFFLIVCGLYLFWLILQVTSFASFRIPTGSMVPALLPGDNILVNKWVMGGRIFNVWDAASKKDVEISRLPSWGEVKRNDVLVFNYPYPSHTDSLGMDLLLYYVKRCIALPGDTLEIRNGYYRIAGVEEKLGNERAQERISRLAGENKQGVVMQAYPWDGRMGWTIQEFGPFPIPAKGQVVKMDTAAVVLYRRVIEWEQKEKLLAKEKGICLGDSAITDYRFKENYYFVSGDNMENSEDSRYWGLLPESYIVGKAVRIWKSVDKANGKMRWDRVFKKIE